MAQTLVCHILGRGRNLIEYSLLLFLLKTFFIFQIGRRIKIGKTQIIENGIVKLWSGSWIARKDRFRCIEWWKWDYLMENAEATGMDRPVRR